MRYSNSLVLLFALGFGGMCVATGQASAQGADHEEEHEEGALEMDAEQRAAQGIITAHAERRLLSDVITAPGEVVVNAYRSTQVTPRISAQVTRRRAQLGDSVTTGQPLVTLSSVEMAGAQGELVVADREWRRVERLGREVVSERRYIEAQVTRQQAYAKVRAYGMTSAQISVLLKQGAASKATGSFDLLSPQNGTVISDGFVVGEIVESGRVLFEISDESILFVEARLAPEAAARVAVGTTARISVDGEHWLDGQVVQHHHRINETTRTQAVRIEVDNREDLLHPGQFVQVAVPTGASAPVVVVPKEAVVLMQGSPTVFKVEGDELHPLAVETGITRGGFTEIKAGLMENEEVVIKGVFLLKSLALKSQIGDHD